MICIQCSSRLFSEKKYIFDTIFSEWFDISYQVKIAPSVSGFLIQLPNDSSLHLSSIFWDGVSEGYLEKNSLPKVCYIENEFTLEKNIPLLYGDKLLEVGSSSINCGIDVFAACFFMLSRMEEPIIAERDSHGRFPATASTAFKYDFLERPIVDEYVEMLWNMLSKLDGSLQRKKRAPSNFITCDVDWPFDPIRRSFYRTLRSTLSDVVRKRRLLSALTTLLVYLKHSIGLAHKDGYREAVTWIMNENERVGNKVAFYFITENTDKLDSDSDFDSVEIRELFRDIHSRGHEIGLHPGYNCFNNPELFKKSAVTLKRILKEEGINQSLLGGRMHYLRWDAVITPKLWNDNGFDYDSTLAFADKAGFRCGTCHSFPMFDLVNRKALNVIQKPLINMECTIIDQRYEALGVLGEGALKRFLFFKHEVYKHKGDYVLLWHNTHLNVDEEENIYKEVISLNDYN